jgi:hypothetical protein
MSAPLVHCYVYYRIDSAHAAAARHALVAVMRTLEERAGISGRLLRRQEDPGMWMEVYENVRDPERFDATLNDLLAAHRFAAFLEPGSTRKTERFVAIADSASGGSGEVT